MVREAEVGVAVRDHRRTVAHARQAGEVHVVARKRTARDTSHTDEELVLTGFRTVPVDVACNISWEVEGTTRVAIRDVALSTAT